MEKQSVMNHTSPNANSNSSPLLEFVSAPMNPVQVGSILHTFLENITQSYRRTPGIILMDPSPPSSPPPPTSTTSNYRKNICQNLKSNFRNSKPKSIVNFQARQSTLKAKLVKYKRSPPKYADIYRKRLETKKNLQSTFTKTNEMTESIPEILKSCGEKSTSKEYLKNTKPSFIPVWIGHKKVLPNSANGQISVTSNESPAQICNKSASRIPKLMLPIISEESLESLKSAAENLNNTKIEKMRSDKSASETPLHKGNQRVLQTGKRFSTKMAAKIPLPLLQSEKNSKTEIKGPSGIALNIHETISSGENRQKSTTENTSSIKTSDSLLDVYMIETPSSLKHISLAKDGRVQTVISSNGSLEDFLLSGKNKPKSNQPSSEALGDNISLAVGDGNNHVYENTVPTSLEISLMESILYHSILSDNVSFEDAAKSLSKIDPNLFNSNYVTLKGHKKGKVQYDGVHVTAYTSKTPSVPCTTKKGIDICRAGEISNLSSESPSTISTPSSSKTSICSDRGITKGDFEHKIENGQTKTDGKISDEGIANLDVDITVSTITSSTQMISDSIIPVESPATAICSEGVIGISNTLDRKTEGVKNDFKKANDGIRKPVIGSKKSAKASFLYHRKRIRSSLPKVSTPNADCTEQIANSDIDPKTEMWEIRAKCVHSNLNIKKADIDITTDKLTTKASSPEIISKLSSTSSVVCVGQAIFPINDDLGLKTENENGKTECKIPEESTSINQKIGVTKSSISSLCQATFSEPSSDVSVSKAICAKQLIVSSDLDIRLETHEMKTECKISEGGITNSDIGTTKSAISSLCQATFSRPSSEVALQNENISEEHSTLISSSLSDHKAESYEMETDDKTSDETAPKDKIVHIRKHTAERVPSYFHGRPPKICQRRTGRNAIKSKQDFSSQDEYTTYLRICLAAREGLLKEIQRSLAKGYTVFQERYAYLHKMDSGMDNIGMDLPNDDWKSLVKSSLKFVYWMNDFCDKNRKELRIFERMNVFRGESKISRFFYKMNVEVAGEDVPGIFVPLPSLIQT